MKQQAQQQVLAVNASTLRHAGSLDSVLERRHRTISRGRAKNEKISAIWDATTQEEDFIDYDANSNEFQYDDVNDGGGNDGDGGNNRVSKSAGEKIQSRRSNSQNSHRQHDKQVIDFGAVRIDIDKGECIYKGNMKTKALDIQSKRLIEADDRLAYRGVANFANNHRRHRTQGDAKIMADALDIIAQESVERGYM